MLNGWTAFVRLVENLVENVVFLKRIEAIRRFYATLDPAALRFFPQQTGTEVAAALASTGIRSRPREMLFTTASMVAAVTSVLVGAGAAVLGTTAELPAAVTATAASLATLVAYGLHILWMYRRGRSTL
jgi:cytochrome c biogenesis protein CcdA